MPLTIEWTDNDRGIIVTAKGPAIDHEFLEIHDTIIADPRHRKTLYHLVDATEVTDIDFKTVKVKESVEQAKFAYSVNPKQAIAVVTTSSLGFGLVRMWQIYMEISGIHSDNNIFRERELAEQWIREVTRDEDLQFK
jgi:hypothetical protein